MPLPIQEPKSTTTLGVHAVRLGLVRGLMCRMQMLLQLTLWSPPQATCALYEVVSAPASGTAVLELYPQLFVALLLRVSCTIGVQLPRNLQAKKRGTSTTLHTRSLEPCR